MSTTLTCAEQFDAEYPEELEDRLAWLERRLRLSRGRILRLMGVSDADGQSWKEIAHAHEAQAERAEHLLTHYLSYFDYDAERAGDFVRDFGRRVEQGTSESLTTFPSWPLPPRRKRRTRRCSAPCTTRG